MFVSKSESPQDRKSERREGSARLVVSQLYYVACSHLRCQRQQNKTSRLQAASLKEHQDCKPQRASDVLQPKLPPNLKR